MPTEAGRRRGRPAGVVVDNDLMRGRRKALALSQTDLAERARLGSRTVRAAERGNPVSVDTAMQLSVTLGIPYVVLVRKTPDEVRARLLERGYAALEPPTPWMDRPELQRVAEVLRGADRGMLACLEGPVGIGKSSAARWVAHQVADAFPEGVIWLTAAKLAEPGRLHRVQRDVAGCLGLVELLPDADLVTAEAFDRAFATRLWSRRRLIVLDDVRDAEHVSRLLHPDSPHWVLVTTSSRYVADQVGGERALLERWDPETAQAMLSQIVDDGRMQADPEGAESLATRSGGVPLVVRTMGETLRRRRYTAPSDYAQELNSSGIEGLGQEEHIRIGALYAFQDRPFSLPFARVATGLSEVGTRLLLEQLSDLYLLREAPSASAEEGAAPRFVLDSASRGLAFWDSNESKRAMDRLVAAAPALAEEISGEVWGEGATVESARRIDVELPTWRLILDEASRRIVGADLQAARSPEEVPDCREDAGDRRVLGKTLRNLRSLLLFQPPDDAGVWVTAALSAARAEGNDEDIRDANWMMMVWWWLGRQRFEEASRWCEPAVRLAERIGPPERTLSAHLFAASLLRYSGGVAAERPHLKAGVALCDGDGLVPRQKACAFGAYASLLMHDGEFEQSEAYTQRAIDCFDTVSEANRPLYGELILNLSVARLQLGKPLSEHEAIAEAIRQVLKAFAGSAPLVSQIIHLGLMLGVDLGLPTPTAAEMFFGVPPDLINSRLIRLMQTVVDLGQSVDGIAYQGAFPTDHGPFTLVTTPFAPRDGRPPMAMVVALPVEPLRRVLSGDGIVAALEFCQTIRGDDDATCQALIRLQNA